MKKYDIYYEDGLNTKCIGKRILREEDNVKYIRIWNENYHVVWDEALTGYIIDWKMPKH